MGNYGDYVSEGFKLEQEVRAMYKDMLDQLPSDQREAVVVKLKKKLGDERKAEAEKRRAQEKTAAEAAAKAKAEALESSRGGAAESLPAWVEELSRENYSAETHRKLNEAVAPEIASAHREISSPDMTISAGGSADLQSLKFNYLRTLSRMYTNANPGANPMELLSGDLKAWVDRSWDDAVSRAEGGTAAT